MILFDNLINQTQLISVRVILWFKYVPNELLEKWWELIFHLIEVVFFYFTQEFQIEHFYWSLGVMKSVHKLYFYVLNTWKYRILNATGSFRSWLRNSYILCLTHWAFPLILRVLLLKVKKHCGNAQLFSCCWLFNMAHVVARNILSWNWFNPYRSIYFIFYLLLRMHLF
jgi:hypothetical protein